MNNIIILIVDDDENLCDYLTRLLAPLGCRIEIAYTLNQGLRLMAELNPVPSFVFLDLNFPDARAQQTIQSISRFHDINPHASIIIITGLLDEKIQQMANALGAAFRQKPDLRSQEDLWKSIEEAIQRGKKEGQEPYEVTTQMIRKITELREPNNSNV